MVSSSGWANMARIFMLLHTDNSRNNYGIIQQVIGYLALANKSTMNCQVSNGTFLFMAPKGE
jgi:hypothetical protein